MIGMRLQEAKANFFDLKKITDPAERATAAALLKFGAFTMRRARKSLKPNKGISTPGSPPSLHVGGKVTRPNRKGKATTKTRYQFRESILFVYDKDRQGVIIGPILFNGARQSPTVPELLEKGGTVQGMYKGKAVAFKYRPRPTMLPAFNEEVKKAPGLWAGQIK
jgi:hypothetical protein